MLLCMSFFVYHQVARTGFFTAAFGGPAMFFFYGPMLLPQSRAPAGGAN
jgi:hypothetical protein